LYNNCHPVVNLFLRSQVMFYLQNRALEVLQSAPVRVRYLAGITGWNFAETYP